MKGDEDAIAARVRTGRKIYSRVNPPYEDSSRTPNYLTMTGAGSSLISCE